MKKENLNTAILCNAVTIIPTKMIFTIVKCCHGYPFNYYEKNCSIDTIDNCTKTKPIYAGTTKIKSIFTGKPKKKENSITEKTTEIHEQK